jgi:hypothetical protein
VNRTFNAGELNDLLNDPAIRPTLGGEGVLDGSALLADRRNVCLTADGGGAMFAWRGPGVFEIHVFLFARGREAKRLICSMLAYMAAEYGARHIWALIPAVSRNVRWMARQCGMKSLGSMQSPDGEQELFEMRF